MSLRLVSDNTGRATKTKKVMAVRKMVDGESYPRYAEIVDITPNEVKEMGYEVRLLMPESIYPSGTAKLEKTLHSKEEVEKWMSLS